MDNSNSVTKESPYLIVRLFTTLTKYISKSLIFVLILVIFTTNLIALSISIKCNKNEGIMFKLASGMYSFMFGILYIFINYYMYRIKLKNDPCTICGNPFAN